MSEPQALEPQALESLEVWAQAARVIGKVIELDAKLQGRDVILPALHYQIADALRDHGLLRKERLCGSLSGA